MSGADMDAEKIKNCVREVLAERTNIPPEKHQAHHQTFDEFLPELRDFLAYRRGRMAKLKRSEERWQKIANTAVGVVVVSVVTALIGALAWIGSLVLQAFIQWVHTPPTGGG